MRKDLDVVQEFMMLASDKDFVGKSNHTALYAIGAVFIELLLEDSIALAEKEHIHIISSSLTSKEYALLALEELNKSKKSRTLKGWIQYFYNHSKLKGKVYRAIMDSLVSNELLEIETVKWFLFFNRKLYKDTAQHRDAIIQKIRAELLEDGELMEDTITLVLLLEANNMLKHYFSAYEHQALKSRLKDLHENELYERVKVIKKAIDEIDATAAMVVVTSAT